MKDLQAREFEIHFRDGVWEEAFCRTWFRRAGFALYEAELSGRCEEDSDDLYKPAIVSRGVPREKKPVSHRQTARSIEQRLREREEGNRE